MSMQVIPEPRTLLSKGTLFGVCWSVGLFAGMDGHLCNVLLPQILDSIGNTQAAALMMSLFLLGWMVGGIGGGMLSDRWGRVRTTALAVVLYTAFTGLLGIISTTWQLAVCRLVTGLGVGAGLVSISVLLAENWPVHNRAVAIGCLLTSYQAGVFVSGMVAAWCPHWRVAMLLGSAPLGLALLIPHLLNNCARREDGVDTAPRKASWSALFSTGQRHSTIVGSLIFGSLLLGYWASATWVPTWLHTLGHAKEQAGIATTLHGIAAVLGCCLAGPLVCCYGHKRSIQVSLAGALGASCWMFGIDNAEVSLVYLQYALLGFFIGLAQATIYIYLPQIFPSNMRASGVGFCLNIGRAITCIVILFMSWLVVMLGGYSQALLAFACLYVVGLLASLWAIEMT